MDYLKWLASQRPYLPWRWLWSHHSCRKPWSRWLCLHAGMRYRHPVSRKGRCGAHLDAWRFRALSQAPCSCDPSAFAPWSWAVTFTVILNGSQLFGMKMVLNPSLILEELFRPWKAAVWGYQTGMGIDTPDFAFWECLWCTGKRSPGSVLPSTGFCQTW